MQVVTGYRYDRCPWWSFEEPGVQEVLEAAYMCQTGDAIVPAMLLPMDPPQRILEGVRVYARAVAAVREDEHRRRMEDLKKKRRPRNG